MSCATVKLAAPPAVLLDVPVEVLRGGELVSVFVVFRDPNGWAGRIDARSGLRKTRLGEIPTAPDFCVRTTKVGPQRTARARQRRGRKRSAGTPQMMPPEVGLSRRTALRDVA
jgi:hypothetical protein